MHRWQICAEYIVSESIYGIAMRAIVDDKISVKFCVGISICIYKPLQVLWQNLSRHGLELTLVSQITDHNDIVAVKTYGFSFYTG